MTYKIFKIEKHWDLPLLSQSLKNLSLLVEVTDTFSKTNFDTFEEAAAMLASYSLKGNRYTVLPVFE